MNGERDKILRMVEEGTISAEEAQELLEAIEDDFVEPAAMETSYDGPDRSQFRSFWKAPFAISMVVMTVGGSLLLRTRQAGGVLGLVRRFLFWPVTILAGVSALITYLSKDGPWLHVRVRSDDGDRFAISLPFPLHLVRGGLRIATSQAPSEEVKEKLDAAAEFLEAVETADIRDPLSIDVMEDGENVQIFIG